MVLTMTSVAVLTVIAQTVETQSRNETIAAFHHAIVGEWSVSTVWLTEGEQFENQPITITTDANMTLVMQNQDFMQETRFVRSGDTMTRTQTPPGELSTLEFSIDRIEPFQSGWRVYEMRSVDTPSGRLDIQDVWAVSGNQWERVTMVRTAGTDSDFDPSIIETASRR